MDFFEELGVKFVKGAKYAGKKAGELTNTAKIRFALANLQADLDELYEKLGKLRYESICQGEDSDKEAILVEKIDSVKDNMEILKAELAASKKKV